MSASAQSRRYPHLKSHVDVFRHIYRGEVWYVFHDRVVDRIYRVSEFGGNLISALDGRRPVSDVIHDFFGAEEDPQEEQQLRHFMRQIDNLGLLAGGQLSRLGAPERQATMARWRAVTNFFKSPISFRVSLIDPEPILKIVAPVTPWLFGRLGMLVWLITVVAGAWVASQHWHELGKDIIDRVFSLQNLAVAGIAYPFIKVVHESMHALALKHYGCEVRRMGIILVAGIPIPYVDATMSMTLPDKYARMMVAGAGVIAELFLFAIATFLWTATEPGLFRTVCYNIIILTGVSTLLFNGNPLQRYDGYYMLCDFIEMPDLGSRSVAYIGYLAKTYLLGVKAIPPRIGPGERRWFVVYGIASWIYRTILTVNIALYVADTFPFVGAFLSIWTLIGAILAPLTAIGVSLQKSTWRSGALLVGRLVLIGAVIGGLLFVLPMPSGVVGQGYVLLPEDAQVKADTSGTLKSWSVSSGQVVEAGEVIAVLNSPAVESRLARVRAEVAEMQATYTQGASISAAQAGISKERLDQSRKELAAAEGEFSNLKIRSPRHGVIVITDPQDQIGNWIPRGETVGIIRPDGAPVVRTVVPQWQIDRVRQGSGSVSVRIAFDPLTVRQGHVLRVVPAATDVLPNPVLSLEGGGTYAVTTRDQEGQHTAEILFRVDIQLADSLPLDYFNGRADVRFDLGYEPLGFQLIRDARLVFLRHFHA